MRWRSWRSLSLRSFVVGDSAKRGMSHYPPRKVDFVTGNVPIVMREHKTVQHQSDAERDLELAELTQLYVNVASNYAAIAKLLAQLAVNTGKSDNFFK